MKFKELSPTNKMLISTTI